MNEVHFTVTLKNSSPINYNSPLTYIHAHKETKQSLFFVEIFIFLCIQQPVCWHISLAPESLFKFDWYVLDILKQAAFAAQLSHAVMTERLMAISKSPNKQLPPPRSSSKNMHVLFMMKGFVKWTVAWSDGGIRDTAVHCSLQSIFLFFFFH